LPHFLFYQDLHKKTVDGQDNDRDDGGPRQVQRQRRTLPVTLGIIDWAPLTIVASFLNYKFIFSIQTKNRFEVVFCCITII